jgi:hypothetical protein
MYSSNNITQTKILINIPSLSILKIIQLLISQLIYSGFNMDIEVFMNVMAM